MVSLNLRSDAMTQIRRFVQSDTTKDGTALDALRDLDPAAVEAVHRRYFPELFRYARYRLGNADAAEDIASESLLRLLEAVTRGRGPKSSLRGWLMGTAHHLVAAHWRQLEARPEEALADDLPAQGDGIEGDMERRTQARALRQAIRQLTPTQQHVLAMRFGGGYSLAEVAATMGKKANAVKAVQFRALARLRRAMEAAP